MTEGRRHGGVQQPRTRADLIPPSFVSSYEGLGTNSNGSPYRDVGLISSIQSSLIPKPAPVPSTAFPSTSFSWRQLQAAEEDSSNDEEKIKEIKAHLMFQEIAFDDIHFLRQLKNTPAGTTNLVRTHPSLFESNKQILPGYLARSGSFGKNDTV